MNRCKILLQTGNGPVNIQKDGLESQVQSAEQHLTIRNIFLDRDGTIIKDRHYLCDPDRIIFIPGSIEAMREMTRQGLNIFLVTNQSGIGRKLFTEKQYKSVQERLVSRLKDNGVEISDTMFCPHTPEDKCSCRKPAAGMWTALSEKYGLQADSSIVAGDKQSDIEFGRNCRFRASILVLTGHGNEQMKKMGILEKPGRYFEPESSSGPDAVAGDIRSAWEWIRKTFKDEF